MDDLDACQQPWLLVYNVPDRNEDWLCSCRPPTTLRLIFMCQPVGLLRTRLLSLSHAPRGLGAWIPRLAFSAGRPLKRPMTPGMARRNMTTKSSMRSGVPGAASAGGTEPHGNPQNVRSSKDEALLHELPALGTGAQVLEVLVSRIPCY